MSQIRKAHSVEIIDRRLKTAEVEGVADAMELIGLHDELSRVERKWKEKSAGEHAPTRPAPKRPPANATLMDERFARLARLIDAMLRRGVTSDAERQLMQVIAGSLKTRVLIAEK